MLASISDVLAHPLFILLTGAVVSSLLIPSVTRRWQDRQKALELKAGLLASLSDAATRIITHAWFRELGGKKKLSDEDRVEFDWRYGEWEVEARRLETQLRAYFTDSKGLAEHWVRYCELLRILHELAWQKMERDRMITALSAAYAKPELWKIVASRRGLFGTQVKEFTERPAQDINWKAFTDTRDSKQYMKEAWPALKIAMEAPIAPLADAILYADMATFRR
jgi:hypothetical protein